MIAKSGVEEREKERGINEESRSRNKIAKDHHEKTIPFVVPIT
jgi:hypothetical protein